MNPMEYRFERFRLLPAARELWRDGHAVSLTRPTFDCLAYLVEHRDRAVGRDELVAALWGRVDVPEARVSELVLRARRTVGDDGQAQRMIRTVPGFGYRWVIDTQAVPARPRASELAGADAATPANVSDASGDAPEAEVAPDAAPPPVAPPSSAKPWWLPALAVIAASAAGIAWLSRGSFVEPPAAAPTATVPTAPANAALDAIAVLPVSVNGPPEAGWVRLGAMDLIADRLRGGGLPVPPSESVLLAVHGSDDAHDGADERARLARVLGVGQVVEGVALRSADGWKVQLETTSAGVHHRVEATDKDVTEAARRSADLLLAALGRTPPARGEENAALDERLQQAQAALLASQLDTARAILDGLPESARDDPRVRYRRAVLDFRSGRFAPAEAALDALVADPAVRADPLLLARVRIVRGKMRFRLDRYADAEQDLDAAIDALQARDAPQDIGAALATRGAVRIGRGDLDAAATDLGQARMRLQQAGDRLGIAQVDTNVGLLEMERGRLERALPVLLDAAARFEAAGVSERAIAVRTAIVQAQSLLLQWNEALATADQEVRMRERSGDAGLDVQIDLDRAKALLGLGRFGEARAVLDAMEQRHDGRFADVARYRDAVVAELAWRQGRLEPAAAAIDRALADWPDNPSDDLRARAVLLQQRIGQARGSPVAAAAAGEARGSGAAALLVAQAERAAAQDRPDEAERAYRAALAAADARGYPADVALVAGSYAPWLLGRQRLDEAEALAGRVAPWAEHDFGSAVLLLQLAHARGRREAWSEAVRRAQALAGERTLPAALLEPPSAPPP